MLRYRGVRLFGVIICASVAICSSAGGARSSSWRLARSLDRVLERPALDRAFVGIMVKDLKTGRVLYSRNEDFLFLPASNEKLLTTAASLYWLGQDFRYSTRFYAAGTTGSDSILHGDLVVVGSGDPSFSKSFGIDPDSVFVSWAESLKAKGISRIGGSILVDESVFDSERLGYGWDWHYLSSWYAAEVSAFSYNDNYVLIDVFPGDSVGQPASVSLSPPTSFVSVSNAVFTSSSGRGCEVRAFRVPSTNDISLSGSLAVDEEKTSLRVSVSNPALFFAHRLLEVFKTDSAGIDGEFYVCDSAPAGTTLLFSYHSPELETIIAITNKESGNLGAEMLFKTMGARLFGKGTFENGARAVKGYLSTIGVDSSMCLTVDGSGLSRRNLVSPRALVKLLSADWSEDSLGVLGNSLSVSGLDGTLKGRMKKEPLAGRVHAKTGTLDQASALSGYVITTSGRHIAFAMLTNHFVQDPGAIKSLEDEVCAILVRYRPVSSRPWEGHRRGKVQ